MRCPKCQIDNDVVLDSRDIHAAMIRRRRRRCKTCGHRWSTKELPEDLVDELLDIVGTHLAVEEALKSTSGRPRVLAAQLFVLEGGTELDTNKDI